MKRRLATALGWLALAGLLLAAAVATSPSTPRCAWEMQRVQGGCQ